MSWWALPPQALQPGTMRAKILRNLKAQILIYTNIQHTALAIALTPTQDYKPPARQPDPPLTQFSPAPKLPPSSSIKVAVPEAPPSHFPPTNKAQMHISQFTKKRHSKDTSQHQKTHPERIRRSIIPMHTNQSKSQSAQ